MATGLKPTERKKINIGHIIGLIILILGVVGVFGYLAYDHFGNSAKIQ
jgi:hypothetical protein